MPLYTFRNINTGEQFDEMMSMSAREQYLKDNPNITQEIVKLNMVSGVGGIKNDAGWKENLSRIAEAHPNSTLADQVGGRSSKTVKNVNALNKSGVRKGKYSMDL
tara:strand:+ start:225 stop:539 length:315 start_codon:yes stop_codon:yes gene_type:complete